MSWQREVENFLLNKDYDQLINFYENKIEINSEDLTNHIYLGLAYLFQGKKEEAQTSWLYILTQEDEESFNKLVGILKEEAQRQKNIKNYSLSLSIYLIIKDILPDNINNLLEVIYLSLQLNKFNINDLDTWNISQLIRENNHQVIKSELLLDVLTKIIEIPHKLSLIFLETCFHQDIITVEFLNEIINISYKVGVERKYQIYAIDLLNLCLQYNFKTRNIYQMLFLYYSRLNDYQNALCFAKEVYSQFHTLADKLTAYDCLLKCYLNLGDWDSVISTGIELKDLLNTIDNLNNFSVNDDHIIAAIVNLLYLQDNLAENRRIINKIGSLFQALNQRMQPLIYPNIQTTIKPLKIGYIGHTFKTHSVGILSRWLMAYHDKNKFEINLYFTQNNQNDFTEKYFTPFVNHIFYGDRNTNTLINKITQDEIDILVDVDSLTLNLTCAVMAVKPAPIQVTWLGLDASGIPNIDYFIADPYVLPDHAQEYYSEKIWRLPQTYLAIDGFEIATPTRRREDFGLGKDDVIFMNLQNPAKLNPDILKSQLKIVNAVPHGYLFTKIRKDEEALKELVTKVAKSENVSLEKLRFIPSDITVETHRANLSIADVVLDTYPYNGSTTTLEALWAEIPVVTRVGEQFAARNSYTYMINAGITEGIAWSDEEYVEWGIKLGTDEQLRKEVSWKLRQSKKTSPLWNGKQFTREMEKAYQQMWDIYINEKKINP